MTFLVWALVLVDPINALCQGVGGCVIVCGEVIGERHDACGAGTALTAGYRHLGCEAATWQGTWAGCNAVFAMRDGGMLGMNSWNHENLKNRTTKLSPERTGLNTRRSGNLLICPFAKGLARQCRGAC